MTSSNRANSSGLIYIFIEKKQAYAALDMGLTMRMIMKILI